MMTSCARIILVVDKDLESGSGTLSGTIDDTKDKTFKANGIDD